MAAMLVASQFVERTVFSSPSDTIESRYRLPRLLDTSEITVDTLLMAAQSGARQ